MRFFRHLSLALTACGSGSGPAVERAPDLGAVNARVPPPLAHDLVFERREVVIANEGRHSLVLAVPKGWDQKVDGVATFRPTAESTTKLGALTRIMIGAACLHGQCSTTNWAAEAEGSFTELLQSRVRKDERGAKHRLVIADVTRNDEVDTEIGFAWWSESVAGFYYCEVVLEDESRAAVDAFEAACRQVRATRR